MQEQIIAPYRADAAWLVGATSYLVDRINPDCERIRLPAKEVPGGVLTFGRGPQPSQPTGRPLAQPRKLRWRAPQTVTLPHGNVFDLRRNAPTNWAHFLNNHLPIVLAVSDGLGLDPRQALLVLPEETPDYICSAAEMLGLESLTTNAALDGEGILYDAEPWIGIRPQRAAWVDTPFVHEALARIDAEPAGADLSERVFLSRRGTRAPLNEGEVMGWLARHGFRKVYPEDLAPADQIRLFRRAEIMVAVHGAGLAPLLYTRPEGRLTHLVEILHAGHMTDVYRVMAQQVGVSWIGVRGQLKPAYIRPAYDFDHTFKAYSLDNFVVDLAALEEAFRMAGIT